MKYFVRLLLVLVVVSVPDILFAQKQAQLAIDSMVRELPKANEDTNKVLLLRTLSFTYYSINPDEGIKYAQQGLDLATKLDWKKGQGWALNSMGINFQYKSDYPKALDCYLKALNLFELVSFKKGISAAISNIGEVYRLQSNYPKALEYNFKALALFEETGNKAGIVNANSNIGILYQDQEDYAKSLEYYFKALKINEGIGDKVVEAAVSGNIGIVYKLNKDYPMALAYYFKQLKIDEEIGNKYGIALASANIGNVFLLQHNYAMSISFHQASLTIDKEIGDRQGVATNLSAMGGVLISIIKDTVKRPAVTNSVEMPEGRYIPGLIPEGRSAMLNKAIDYLQQGLQIGKEIQSLDVLQTSYELLAEAYKLNNDYKKAMECNDLAREINDSIFSKENSQKIMRLEYDRMRFTDSLKTDEARKITEMKMQQQRNYMYAFGAGVLLLLAFVVVIFRNNKLLVKEKKRSEGLLKRSDELLLNIMPLEVANELKEKGSAEAKHFDNVTVLFTDFVNFTNAVENMTPRDLIDELHACFKAFDEIAGKYNIEKIKTIGDAYLAVSGLPQADPAHAENIVRAAIEINTFMKIRQAKLGDRTFTLRIGIHSGSVIAGIVGVKKFAYDIWGDTVNTAARLEQHGEPGKINISQTTYELVKDQFKCVYRGEVEAKNKGSLKMYFVSPINS
jgi:adenylate cyclase